MEPMLCLTFFCFVQNDKIALIPEILTLGIFATFLLHIQNDLKPFMLKIRHLRIVCIIV